MTAKKQGERKMKIKMICALFTATALAAGAMAGCHVNKDAKENSTATEAIISTADSAAVGTADSAPFTGLSEVV